MYLVDAEGKVITIAIVAVVVEPAELVFVDSSYDTAYGSLKTNYSYIFLNARDAT